jgi:hypothetical protein
MERARELDVPGRSSMKKVELKAAVIKQYDKLAER